MPFVCNILFPASSPQCELDSVSTKVSNYRKKKCGTQRVTQQVLL